MGCDCGKQCGDAEERMYAVLGEAGLREIGEQARSIRGVLADSVRALKKADRAEALNLGGEVVRLYRDSGERANRKARRQYRHLIERIDERMGRDDWPALVQRERRTFKERDGHDVFEDAAARIHTTLLEEDAFSAASVTQIREVWEETADRFIREGLDGSLLLLRERLEVGLAALETPRVSPQSGPFDPVASAQCIAVACGLAVIALGVCAAFFFCVFTPAILATLLVAILACATL